MIKTDPLHDAKVIITNTIFEAFAHIFPEQKITDDLRAKISSRIAKPTVDGKGDLAVPCFLFPRPMVQNKDSNTVATLLAKRVSLMLLRPEIACVVETVTPDGPFLNFHLSLTFLARVIPSILDGTFLAPLPSEVKDSKNKKEKVMIEFSQPNTHKAFHVGHMRNVALGDCLVKLFEQCGHTTIAANYYGDEGAHIAKCLWFMLKDCEEKKTDINELLAGVPVENRGEWLGSYYAKAVEALELGSLTSLPYPGVVAAKVAGVRPLEGHDKHLHVVDLMLAETDAVKVIKVQKEIKVAKEIKVPEEIKETKEIKETEKVKKTVRFKEAEMKEAKETGDDEQAKEVKETEQPEVKETERPEVKETKRPKETVTVVCGGAGFSVGDIVAYVPEGSIFGGKRVEARDVNGVTSRGFLASEKELSAIGD